MVLGVGVGVSRVRMCGGSRVGARVCERALVWGRRGCYNPCSLTPIAAVPGRAARPCTYPGCHVLVRDGTSRCPPHTKVWHKHNETERLTGRRAVARRARLLRDQPLCKACESAGRVALATELDHIEPLSRGGVDDESNLQPLCYRCHKTKTQAEANAARAAG